ncbi:hypothetical protein BDV3_005012 [Batrachochytrium dendrobatidis]|nr:hypothetical protein BDEG_28697 [Batrachochytrium dendrobatidis JEL423]
MVAVLFIFQYIVLAVFISTTPQVLAQESSDTVSSAHQHVQPNLNSVAMDILFQKRDNDPSQRNGCRRAFQPSPSSAASNTPSRTNSPSPPAPKPPPSNAADFSRRCLDRMNYYRRLHKRPDLIMTDTLIASAQDWASNCEWRHNFGGQNLYSGKDPSCIGAVDMWYDEIKLLRTNPVYVSSVFTFAGHFTQIVSPNSIYAGCAVGCKTVCNFSPPGNIVGSWMSY